MLFIDMRFLFLFLFLPLTALAQTVLEGKAQGTYYVIKYIASDTSSLQPEIDSIFAVIDQSLSLYKPNSLINQFNEKGHVQMDTHMQAVIARSLEISRITRGAFDITVKPLVDAWGFGVHQPAERKVPSPDTINAVLSYVGYKYLEVKGTELSRTKPKVTIDCNGIAQGYTTDVIGRFLDSKGIHNYLVDVGGELCAKGKNAHQQYWTVGIEGEQQRIIPLINSAVTTSGNYRRFFDSGAKRFAHTIDPRSGQAIHNNIISVTVLATNAITADGFDNALILMGVKRSFAFIKQHPELQLEAGFIYKDTEGNIQEAFSPGFPK
ncbi:FAD:protein FMN transferase [Chitinophaga silvisoli]|uniref:FAD:protein FMN transferase n=1 Tax=Chitinophaga silvisoli TaxID=2291814 RepID=A0A3E1NW01_9BACT|nr:FAD:protein FMN transferase [Chitinophaga silvisoli]RFM32115.1 FAD:protein FMN transferase [Chitinophaga silvisoli]